MGPGPALTVLATSGLLSGTATSSGRRLLIGFFICLKVFARRVIKLVHILGFYLRLFDNALSEASITRQHNTAQSIASIDGS